MKLRNRAVRQAIMDNIQYIKGKGIEVISLDFGLLYYLDAKWIIAYSTQEQLLQGLINLAKDIENGNESRVTINITNDSWVLRNSDDQPWNRWFRGDERETENLILEYMARLRADAS